MITLRISQLVYGDEFKLLFFMLISLFVPHNYYFPDPIFLYEFSFLTSKRYSLHQLSNQMYLAMSATDTVTGKTNSVAETKDVKLIFLKAFETLAGRVKK